MLNEQGGVHRRSDRVLPRRSRWFRLVVNAGTRDKDLAWISAQAQPFAVAGERAHRSRHARGPGARGARQGGADPAVGGGAPRRSRSPAFVGRELDRWFVARTGYTGEDGFEIMLPAADAVPAWRSLNALGVAPAGSVRATRCDWKPA